MIRLAPLSPFRVQYTHLPLCFLLPPDAALASTDDDDATLVPTAPDDADTTPLTVGIINAVYTGACQGEEQDCPPSMSDLSLPIVGILMSACVKFASAQSSGEKLS